MDPIQQLSAMRSQAQRAQLESWLGMQLPFDDEVLEYLLQVSKLVESEELSLLVADFCPHWPEGMQLALAASLSPQALRIRHGVPGSKQILLEPAPGRQERCELPGGRTIRGVEPDIRPKIKPMLPEAPRKEMPEVEFITKAEPVPVDLQQTIKDIVQEQLALQQRLQRSISPKAGAALPGRPLDSRCASPEAEAERRQKCTSYRPREQSIQEIINQQLLLQEQLRPLADGGQDRETGMMVTLDSPKPMPSEGIEFKELMPVDRRPVKDLSCTQETELGGGELQRCTEDDSGVLSREELRLREERRPAARPTRHRKRSRPGSHHISTGRLIDVAVKFPDGRSSWQRSAPEATTLDLKKRLARESGLDTEILRLTFLGLRLKDHWRLVDCGIRAHDKLQASYVGPHAFKDLGGRELGRQSAGPLPSLDDPLKEDASCPSPVQSPAESPKEAAEPAEPRWSAAVASLQQGIHALQETMKTSQQQQHEKLADCRHSLSMLQQQQQHQLQALQFIEDQQRSLFKTAESSEMKEGLKQLQLEQQQLRARLSHLRQDLHRKPPMEMVQSSPENGWEEALSPVPLVSPVSPAVSHRRWLILQVFRMLDRDRDGLLQQQELMGLARLMGFNFSEDEWRAEYQQLCSDMEIHPQKGFDSISFTKLLDSEDGCPATDENLFEALINHCPDKRRATAAVELFERLDLDGDGFLSTGELRELPAMQGISLEGADHYGRFDLAAFHLLVAPLTLAQLQRAPSPPALQVDVADVDVASVESPWAQSPSHPSPSHPSTKSASPTSEAQESPGADARRNALMAQLFNALDADGDGRCSSKDLGVVFAARYEAWPMHFRKLCSHWKVKQREGVDAQTFAEMLEDRGELGLYVSEDDLETMISSLRQPRVGRRVSIQDRSRLIDALFFYLDSNQDGLLDEMELQVLAKALNVEISQDSRDENGLDLDAFRKMVNDGDQCLYCDDSSLPSLLARFSRKG